MVRHPLAVSSIPCQDNLMDYIRVFRSCLYCKIELGTKECSEGDVIREQILQHFKSCEALHSVRLEISEKMSLLILSRIVVLLAESIKNTSA